MAQDRKQIVVFGSIVHDLISYTTRFPRPGESIRGKSFQQGAGGKGANQAVAAALLGARVSMIGKVGDDIFADFNLTSLKKAGVETAAVQRVAGSTTGTATITVSEEGGGENSIVVTLGANMEMSPETADGAEAVIAPGGILLCQAEIPDAATKRALEIGRKHGVTTFLNPAPGDPAMDQSMLAFVDIVCVNENEAEFITGIASPNPAEAEKAARAMLERGPRVAIITLGPQGCLLAEKDEGVITVSLLPGEKVAAVDTTGAGDCFCGSFVALLAAGIPLKEAAARSVKIASISVTKIGTQSSYSSRAELIAVGRGELVEGI
ncbi:hypothetical protein PRIPAC_89341 [Pristionchus pacificus]|uniref:Ribokinase n=1 Tax=Pristionchus pacificus TaxID=54126 RepID=A0A454XXV5_PRIPA|nr:hypothetical protein PRIPAC_89341 [Pristionchus pacificus]|eukprot:PDM82316.1 hypothetical protein PRIPAC_36709 [Pristionchus pacificus]